MNRIEPLFNHTFNGAVLVVPNQIKAIRVHYIHVRPGNRTHTVLIPRICLKQHVSLTEFDNTPCPYCANTLSTVVTTFVMWNEFSSSFVQVPRGTAERVHSAIESPLDEFFGTVEHKYHKRSKRNVVSIAREGVALRFKRVKSVTPLYVKRCDVPVPDELVSPKSYDDALKESDKIMRDLFALLTDNMQKDIIRFLEGRGYDNLNFVLKYVNLTYRGLKVFSMCEGELTCDGGRVFDMHDAFRNDSKHLRFTSLCEVKNDEKL